MSLLPMASAPASLENAAPPLPPRKGQSPHIPNYDAQDSYFSKNPGRDSTPPVTPLSHQRSYSSLNQPPSVQSQLVPPPPYSSPFLTPPITQHDLKAQSTSTPDCYSPGSASPLIRPYSAPIDQSVLVDSPNNGASRQTAGDEKSNWGMRFLGNTLNGRFVRAGTRSFVSTAISPLYLSPWGDNNPITLPNVRKRDFGYAAIGDLVYEDIFESSVEILDNGMDHISKFFISEMAGNAAEETVNRLKPAKPLKIVRTAQWKSVEVRIKHKLIGKNADIRFFGEYPARHRTASDKGWFCPYLYASGRTPFIPRAHDFVVAAFSGPGLQADAALASTLLRLMEDRDTSINALCDTSPPRDIGCSRLLVLCLGISPWRTQAWSQARNPGEARLRFHLLNDAPALVLPVVNEAPICAWSPWTLYQMHEEEFKPERQVEDLYNYLGSIIRPDHVMVSAKGGYQDVLRAGLSSIVQSAVDTKSMATGISKIVDLKRVGVVMFKF